MTLSGMLCYRIRKLKSEYDGIIIVDLNTREVYTLDLKNVKKSKEFYRDPVIKKYRRHKVVKIKRFYNNIAVYLKKEKEEEEKCTQEV